MNTFRKYFILIACALFVPALGVLHAQVVNPNALDILKVEFAGGRSTTYELVPRPLLKPELPPPAPEPVRVPAPLSAAKLERNRVWEAKRQVNVFLSGTVYGEGVSEVRWWEEGKEIILLSSINFNTIEFSTQFETVDSVYSFMFFLGEESLLELKDGNKQSQIAMLKDRSTQQSYYLITQGQLSAKTLQTLNDLHRYYDQHQVKLKKDYAEQQALRAKQEAWLRANPPQPEQSVVTYFPILSDYQERKKP